MLSCRHIIGKGPSDRVGPACGRFQSIMGVFCLNTEVITTGRTVEEAIEEACRQLGAQRDEVEFEILTLPKKGFLGLKFTPAKVKVVKPFTKGECAADYLKGILRSMGFEQVEVKVKEDEEGAVLSLEGEDLGVIIGRRGETLDALQYLCSLVANRLEGGYFRISIDIGDYRQKREATLQALAKKLAGQAVRTGKSVSLEPMNPYERRIIHSAVQLVPGATSRSIGEEPNRRVVISSTVAPQRKSRQSRSSAPRATAVQTPEATIFEVQEEGARSGERRSGSRPPRQGGRPGSRSGGYKGSGGPRRDSRSGSRPRYYEGADGEREKAGAAVSTEGGEDAARESSRPSYSREGGGRSYPRRERYHDSARAAETASSEADSQSDVPVSTTPAEKIEAAEVKDKPLYSKIDLD